MVVRATSPRQWTHRFRVDFFDVQCKCNILGFLHLLRLGCSSALLTWSSPSLSFFSSSQVLVYTSTRKGSAIAIKCKVFSDQVDVLCGGHENTCYNVSWKSKLVKKHTPPPMMLQLNQECINKPWCLRAPGESWQHPQWRNQSSRGLFLWWGTVSCKSSYFKCLYKDDLW